MTQTINGPHQNQKIMTAGRALDEARAAMILVHGRGATAESILSLATELDQDDFAYLAPQAAQNTWYPHSFMAPIPNNQPGIDSGLSRLGELIERIVAASIPHERIMLLGFSQGACLATEFVVRHARRYGGVVGLSGGLIGPPGTTWGYEGSLDETAVFLGCSDIDFHIPKERVEETAVVMKQMGGSVTMRLYPGMGHTVNQDEIDFVRHMMAQVAALR
ncbi:MAG: phospholipase [Chloroflexota bacterium]